MGLVVFTFSEPFEIVIEKIGVEKPREWRDIIFFKSRFLCTIL